MTAEKAHRTRNRSDFWLRKSKRDEMKRSGALSALEALLCVTFGEQCMGQLSIYLTLSSNTCFADAQVGYETRTHKANARLLHHRTISSVSAGTNPLTPRSLNSRSSSSLGR